MSVCLSVRQKHSDKRIVAILVILVFCETSDVVKF